MNTSPDNEIKRIYEKSVRLLNDKQARLMDMQQLLKKAVIRLSHASRGDDEQVNTILDHIDVSVEEHIDLSVLNKELDNLFVIINQSGYKHSSAKSDAFHLHLKNSLDKLGNDLTKGEYISRLQGLVDNKVPNDEMSSQILTCIKEFSEERNNQSTCIDVFIENITDGTEFEFEKKDLDTSKILQDLAIELVEYIYKVKNDNKIGIGELGANTDGLTVNINHMLLELVNQLTLPNEAKKDQFTLAKILNRSDNNKETWANAIQKLILLSDLIS